TALVLQGEEVTLALVTADLVGLPQELVEKLRVAVRSSTGIPPDNVLVAATHTHSGPDLLFGDQGLASEAYVKVLVDTLAGSVYAAWCSLQPAEVGVRQGWVEGIGVNRRTPAGTPVDPRVGVLRVDHDGRPRGVLMNYTCHPVVLGPDNLFITADYPGYAVRVVERVFGEGFTAMFTNGAAGDINTGHSAELSALGEKIPGRTFERAEKLGTMLAGEVLEVLETIEPSSNIPIAALTKEISLPLKPLPSLKEAEASVKQKEQALTELMQRKAPAELITKARIEKLYADLLLKQVHERSQSPNDGVKRVELQAIRIGDCALLAFPGELFVEIGLEIKAKSPFKYTYIVGYANGYVGYVPTKQAFEEGGYEAVTAQFVPETSDIVIEESLALLNSLT
ncbi:MAG: neutral/alkaline non-lysosomal ceramidase N-terminal domain-containing protein, partial [Clostridia bacterium]|nr:neutral/alkaline non-lysosomal ceramidase N-terminal domain-containing protein [Clostridia bacterium]